MKFNLKYLYILLITVFVNVTVIAQDKDKVEAFRVSFITQKINLSSPEAQSFWPLYNEYNDKIKSLRKSFRKSYGNVTEFASDKDADDYLNAELKLKQSELDTQKEYFEKFKKVLGSKKTGMLRKAEDDFKREIIKTIKGNGNDS